MRNLRNIVSVLAVMTCLLATFTLNVPLISGYTVARYEQRLSRDS